MSVPTKRATYNTSTLPRETKLGSLPAGIHNIISFSPIPFNESPPIPDASEADGVLDGDTSGIAGWRGSLRVMMLKLTYFAPKNYSSYILSLLLRIVSGSTLSHFVLSVSALHTTK